MKKRKIILLFFVIALSSGKTINVALATNISTNNNTKKYRLLEKINNTYGLNENKNLLIENYKFEEDEQRNIEIEKNNNEENNQKKISYKQKKQLKKEIKRRKGYHKDLLLQYNQSFNNEYLDLIGKNSQILNSLRNEYKKNST